MKYFFILVLFSLSIIFTSFSNVNIFEDTPFDDDSTYNHMLEYSELEDLDIQLPYVYEYSNNKKSILVFGSYHTSDPNDKIILEIENSFNTFKPDLVFYEGDGISYVDTKEESIRYYFEMGLVRYLCHNQNILDKNLEPSIKSRYQYLLNLFPKDEVFLANIGSQIALLLNSTENIDSIDFIKKYKQFVKDFQKEGFPLAEHEKDINYFYSIYKRFYGIHFDLKTFDYETIEVKFNKTRLNRINQKSAQYRDNFMLRLIEDQLSKFDRIYIQIGGRHAIVCESAINSIIKRNSLTKEK